MRETQTAYCSPRRNPFVPSMGSMVHIPDQALSHGAKPDREVRTASSTTGVIPEINGIQDLFIGDFVPRTYSPLFKVAISEFFSEGIIAS